MGNYRTRTSYAGLQRLIDTYIAEVPDWISVPDSVKAIFRHQDVVQALLGEECVHFTYKPEKRSASVEVKLTEEEQVKLAIKVCNAAFVLLDPVIHGGEMDEYTNKIQENVYDILMSCEPGVAWLALRNTWGYEWVNQTKKKRSLERFLCFVSTYWFPLFKRIKVDPIFREQPKVEPPSAY